MGDRTRVSEGGTVRLDARQRELVLSGLGILMRADGMAPKRAEIETVMETVEAASVDLTIFDLKAERDILRSLVAWMSPWIDDQIIYHSATLTAAEERAYRHATTWSRSSSDPPSSPSSSQLGRGQ